MTDNATIAALADRPAYNAGDIEKDILRICDALGEIKRAAVETEFCVLRDTLKHRRTILPKQEIALTFSDQRSAAVPSSRALYRIGEGRRSFGPARANGL